MASSNWTLKFWAVFHSAQHAASGQASCPAPWERLLAEAAQLPQEWERWLAVFNEYPAHYPQLQHTLGEILSGLSGAALDAYMASLEDSEGNRQQIAATLTCFREHASLSQRQRLWTAAYQRWLKWDFGCTAQSQYVGNVKHSAFDFPLMGYLTECLDASARADWGEKLHRLAAAIDREWHADITQPMTERFKLISTYQLLVHAEHVASGTIDWLVELPLHQPVWEDGTLFRALRYEDPFGSPTFLEQPKT